MGPEWLLIGDFNLICGAEDKNNNHLNLTMINRFKRVIDDLQLAEIALHGRKFTWCNDQRSPTMTRIDHLFASTDWLELFPKANLQALASLSALTIARYFSKETLLSISTTASAFKVMVDPITRFPLDSSIAMATASQHSGRHPGSCKIARTAKAKRLAPECPNARASCPPPCSFR